MDAKTIKGYLQEIAHKVDENTTIEDVYNHFSLLRDIDEAEEQMRMGLVVPHAEVKKMSQEWLR
jgi:hypothetical protein